MNTYPFVVPRMWPVMNIDSTPTIIFGNDQTTCILDSIIISNLTSNQILVSLYIAREITIGTESDFIFGNSIPINPNDRIDILKGSTITLELGDLLYAYSDFSGNTFNTFISYRELNQLSAITQGNINNVSDQSSFPRNPSRHSTP